MTAEEIARKLTPRQRTAVIVATPARGSPSTWLLTIYRDRGVLNASLVEIGIAEYSKHGAMLTPLGLEVRASIEGKSSE